MKRTIFCMLLILFGLRVYALEEVEPNGDPSLASGPFGFPDTLTGNFTNDGEGLRDFFRFTSISGIRLRFEATPGGGPFAPDIGLAIWQGNQELVSVDVGGVNQGETLIFETPETGTYYLEIYEATGFANPAATYTVATSLVEGDYTPPFWPNDGVGIKTAQRIAGNTAAEITWYRASDSIAIVLPIDYLIFYDEVQANVFTGEAERVVSNVLSTTLTGLDPLKSYYVGVRARDLAGNVDTNTRTLLLGHAPSSAHRVWTFYE